MAWLRLGDTISTDPLLFYLLEICDGSHALRNEAWGFLTLAGSISACHLTDYVVSYGMADSIAPGRSRELITLLIGAGLMEPVEVDGRAMVKIIDNPELIHMRTAEEVTLDRARKRDYRTPELMIPVRVRDGDVCRWCGKTVNFADHKSARGGTIDSLNGHRESTVETLVVACRGCNSKRSQGAELALLPAPTREEVHYLDSTITYINATEYAKSEGIHLTSRQTRLDFGEAAGTGRYGATNPATAPEVQRQAAAEETPAAPRSATQKPSGARTEDITPPDWVFMSLEEITAKKAAGTGRYGATNPATAPEVQRQAAVEETPAAPHTSPATAPEVQRQAAVEETPAAPQAAGTGRYGAETSHKTNKCNKTVKPNTKSKPDPNHQGDGSSLSGSGRVGSGRDRPSRVGTERERKNLDHRKSSSKRRKRRGRRGGKSS